MFLCTNEFQLHAESQQHQHPQPCRMFSLHWYIKVHTQKNIRFKALTANYTIREKILSDAV